MTNCKRKGLDTLLKIRETGSTDQRHESGRAKHARTEENLTTVDELVGLLNLEDQTHVVQHARYPDRLVQHSVAPYGSFTAILVRGVSFVIPTRLLPIIVSFPYIYISQGSVATQLRCGEIFINYFIANCPLSVPVKKI